MTARKFKWMIEWLIDWVKEWINEYWISILVGDQKRLRMNFPAAASMLSLWITKVSVYFTAGWLCCWFRLDAIHELKTSLMWKEDKKKKKIRINFWVFYFSFDFGILTGAFENSGKIADQRISASNWPAMADNAFIGAILVFPLCTCYGRVGAPLTDAMISGDPAVDSQAPCTRAVHVLPVRGI